MAKKYHFTILKPMDSCLISTSKLSPVVYYMCSGNTILPGCIVGNPFLGLCESSLVEHSLTMYLSDASLLLSNASLSIQGELEQSLPQDRCGHCVAQWWAGCCPSSPGSRGAASPWRWHFQVFGVSSASLPVFPTSCSNSEFCFHSQ